MTPFEWLSVVGLVIGPVVAVLITLWVERRRATRAHQLQVLRMLLSTRKTPADPLYSAAINLIPAEFDGDSTVMAAWRSYIESVRYSPTAENEEAHSRLLEANQTTLIYAAMKSFGFKLSEEDIRISAYAADSFLLRDQIQVRSWAAMIDVAEALKRQTQLLESGGFGPPPET